MNGSFTWGHQEAKHGDAGYTNPTNLWAYEGQAYSPNFGGGSGKINQYIFTRWIYKLAGLYQLPMGVNIAATVLAREGYIQKETVRITDYTLPNPQSRTATLDMTPFGSQRLPKTMLVTLRLEKMFKLGDVGRVYLMADMFNVFNSPTVNRRNQPYHGQYYIFPDAADNYFVANPNSNRLNEILNPRVTRFGLRFTF